MTRTPIASASSWYRRRTKFVSHAMQGACVGSAIAIAGILVIVIAYFVANGGVALDWTLLSQLPKARGMPGYPGGMVNGLFGTAILLALASVVGLPIGILTGVFLSEYAARSRLAAPVRFLCDVLAGVPSIVVGIVGYELLVVPVGHFNGYAGALALAIVMIPIVARSTEEMLLLVPNSFREASLALGATRATTIVRVVLPAATGGVLTGVMLALARVASETAPLLFTALNNQFWSTDMTRPFPNLPVVIFQFAMSPYEDWQRLAWAGALIITAAILLINVIARVLLRRRPT